MPALCSAALDPSAVLVESGRSQQQVLLVTTGKGDLSVFRDGQQAGAHMLSAAWLGWPIRRPAGDAVLWCAYRAPTWQAHTARKCFTADVVELPAASCVELLCLHAGLTLFPLRPATPMQGVRPFMCAAAYSPSPGEPQSKASNFGVRGLPPVSTGYHCCRLLLFVAAACPQYRLMCVQLRHLCVKAASCSTGAVSATQACCCTERWSLLLGPRAAADWRCPVTTCTQQASETQCQQGGLEVPAWQPEAWVSFTETDGKVLHATAACRPVVQRCPVLPRLPRRSV